jgi:hypothetical protein
MKCKTPKSQKQETVSDTGSWGCQELLLQESRSSEMQNRDMLNHDIISTVGSKIKLDRRSKKDTWRKIILSLTGNSKE